MLDAADSLMMMVKVMPAQMRFKSWPDHLSLFLSANYIYAFATPLGERTFDLLAIVGLDLPLP